jgi:sec-independent protein translocase protein TatA
MRTGFGTRTIGAPVGKGDHKMLGEIFGVDGMIVLVVLVALLFGGAAIPKLARNLGSAKNEFAKGLDEGKTDSLSSATDDTVTAAPSSVPSSTS